MRLGDGWLTDNSESAALLGPKIERFRQQSSTGRSGIVVFNRPYQILDPAAYLARLRHAGGEVLELEVL